MHKAPGEQIAYAQSPLLDTPCTPQHDKHFISRLRKGCEEPILELNALLKRRRVRIAGQYQSSLPSQSATAGEEVQRLINLWRGDFTPGGPFGVPCPFVYSGGLKCDGYIIRVDGHKKMGTSWIQDAKGKWQAEEGCGDLIIYRLFCSVKGGHDNRGYSLGHLWKLGIHLEKRKEDEIAAWKFFLGPE